MMYAISSGTERQVSGNIPAICLSASTDVGTNEYPFLSLSVTG